MKKQHLKTLKLNKKAISNFQIKGGVPPNTYNCAPIDKDSIGCNPVGWLTEDGRHICKRW